MVDSLLQLVFTSVACLAVLQPQSECIQQHLTSPQVAGAHIVAPKRTGESLDVVLTAKAAFAWDVTSGHVLYERAADERRPVASLNKLLSALVVREQVPLEQVVEIPVAVRQAQRQGADVQLPVGEHATVQELLAASLIPSANDAMITLAHAVAGSEAAFVEVANTYALAQGWPNSRLATATGLAGGDQYSTARDVGGMLERAYRDPVLRDFLATERSSLTTQEGSQRVFISTNKLLSTYVPIVAAKTGYTLEAQENLVIITRNAAGHEVGAVILGSENRFQDMKVLVEWLWRNYTWQ